ncbi:MAG: hypothetical protein AAGG38_00560 [Planctomycetota bacterium]
MILFQRLFFPHSPPAGLALTFRDSKNQRRDVQQAKSEKAVVVSIKPGGERENIGLLGRSGVGLGNTCVEG